MLGEDEQKEEINKLLDYKVKNIKLEDELKCLRKEYTNKVAVYDKTWEYSQERKKKITKLESTLKEELDIRAKLEDDLKEKISNEKEKAREEKERRTKANKDNKKLITENRTLNDQLKEARSEYTDLNNE